MLPWNLAEKYVEQDPRITYQFGAFEFDPREQTLATKGTVVSLQQKASEILLALVQAAGRIVYKGDLISRIWPDSFVEERNIAQHVSTLRKALGRSGDGRDYIETAQRRGYRFVAAVREVMVGDAQGDTDMAGAGDGATVCRTNTPLQPNALIGREEEVRTITALLMLETTRLVTLTGAPGAGKTRLAIQVAAGAVTEFPDGVFFVELASIRDPGLVASAIASTIGVKQAVDTTLADTLKQHLNGRRMLLLLDNFEHLLPAAVLVAELLAWASDFRVLATSRARLNISWEQQYTVDPLAVPDSTLEMPALEHAGLEPSWNGRASQRKARATLQALRECPAVALFLQRARAVTPDFALTQENAPAVAEICRRLDGLPLAIELLAAHIGTFSPSAMLSHLGAGMDLLSGGLQDAPPQHQTMHRAIDWSHDLLSEDEQRLFRRLSVFVGGFTSEGAEEVCRGEECPEATLMPALIALISKSIIGRKNSQGEPRFTVLEVVREYGLERLAASGEMNVLQRRHADFFCRLAEQYERSRRKGEAAGSALAVLGDEIGNLRAAMGWSRDSRGLELQLRTASALRSFWADRGQHEEGLKWLDVALSSETLVSPLTRAKALDASGLLVRLRGDYENAVTRTEQALSLYRELGDDDAIADSLMSLGNTWTSAGFPDRGIGLLEESLVIRRDRGETGRIASLLNNIATVFYLRGNYDQSFALHEESLSLFRLTRQKWGSACCLNNLGRLLTLNGKYGDAHAYLQGCLDLASEACNDFLIHICLESCAALACAKGDHEKALRLLAAVDKWRKATNTLVSLGSDFETTLATARLRVDEKTFETLWEEGRTMTRDEAISFALEPTASAPILMD
jgi:predicted ATPase/DNA-binding winged helix-turn-helix (wHTH) protein